MKRAALLLCWLLAALPALAQELYVNTEPASNMAAHSLGIRLENQGYFNPVYKNRSTLELMYGASRSLMVHGSVYVSNFYQPNQHFEGFSAYAKYRFLSMDSVQRHFRMAAFAKVSSVSNPIPNQEISLEGDNSGLQGGVVATQLLHKLALSGSLSYLHAWENRGGYQPAVNSSLAYTFSAGLLMLPRHYKNYDQTNLNLYAELLGKTNPSGGQSYLDVAPAVQLIFNSVFRVDASYRLPLYSDMQRNTAHMYLLRLEYNIFNLFN